MIKKVEIALITLIVEIALIILIVHAFDPSLSVHLSLPCSRETEDSSWFIECNIPTYLMSDFDIKLILAPTIGSDIFGYLFSRKPKEDHHLILVTDHANNTRHSLVPTIRDIHSTALFYIHRDIHSTALFYFH